MRIHSGPGDSVSTKRPDIHSRLNSDEGISLLDRRSPYTYFALSLNGSFSLPRKAPKQLIALLDGFSDAKDRIRFRVLGFDIPIREGRVAPFVEDPQMGEFFATPGSVYWDNASFWSVCN